MNRSRSSPLEQLTGKSLDDLTEDELVAWLETLGGMLTMKIWLR